MLFLSSLSRRLGAFSCVFALGAMLLSTAAVSAATYPFPAAPDTVVGATQSVAARYEDTLLDIAREHQIGQDAIVLANPHIDRWLPGEGTPVIIPSQFVLPDTPYEGLVLNLPEMRLYFYPPPVSGELQSVQTYPVSIGRRDWSTPKGITRIVNKLKDPAWYPPASLREEHAADGDPLPTVVPPGPDNPLGRYAMLLDIPGYLIHGTNKLFGIGMQVSHGCIRMSPEDIEFLFPQVAQGTTVRIVNQPAKVGWLGDKLYLEVHPLMEGLQDESINVIQVVDTAIQRAKRERHIATGRRVQWDEAAIEAAIRSRSGLPVAIAELL